MIEPYKKGHCNNFEGFSNVSVHIHLEKGQIALQKWDKDIESPVDSPQVVWSGEQMLVFEEMVSGFGGYDESGEEVDDAKYHVIENIIYATLI